MTQNAYDLKKIVNGPSKMDLMLAMFDSSFPNHRSVVFNFENEGASNFKASAPCHISMVEKEDGSGESFNFEGTLSYDNFRTGKRVRGCYNTMRRTGFFHFVQ